MQSIIFYNIPSAIQRMHYEYRFLFLLFFVVTLLSSCKNDPEEVKELMARFETKIERAEEVEIIYSDSAQLKVKVQAPVMLYHLDKNEPLQEFPESLIVDFYGPDQKMNSRLTANYAIRNERLGLVTVRDSVVWFSIKGEKLETEELIWDEKQEKVFTNKFVRITRPEEILYGHGFEANQDFSDARIKAVTGRIKVENTGLKD